jgi:hypothetical protein
MCAAGPLEEPQPVLELRDAKLELVPFVSRHEAELARDVLHPPLRPFSEPDRVAPPAPRHIVEDRPHLVEPRPEQAEQLLEVG